MQNIIKRTLTFSRRANFGGAAAHHAPVVLQNSNFISQPENPIVFGFQDIEDHHHHDHHHYDDPFVHIRQKGFFSFERQVFADPHYHVDEGEPLMNTPHGYLLGNDDPLDPRNNYERPLLEFLTISIIAIAIGVMLGTQGLYLTSGGNRLYNGIVTAEQIEDEIRKIRKENQKLESRLQELQQ